MLWQHIRVVHGCVQYVHKCLRHTILTAQRPTQTLAACMRTYICASHPPLSLSCRVVVRRSNPNRFTRIKGHVPTNSNLVSSSASLYLRTRQIAAPPAPEPAPAHYTAQVVSPTVRGEASLRVPAQHAVRQRAQPAQGVREVERQLPEPDGQRDGRHSAGRSQGGVCIL